MQIDLRTVTIKPLRNTYAHVARHIGGDKVASRYQEGTIGIQAEGNFHYRPLWDPERLVFDRGRTALVMKNWYSFSDPRQFYYGAYTLARARMQEAAEADFSLVEDRGLVSLMTPEARSLALSILVPLRHLEWGGNMNNCYISAYGYGTALCNPALFHAMDRLGNAQYLTRIGLLLEDETYLDRAKADWMTHPAWQGLRKYVEDCFVLTDWFELYVAHNLVLDGLVYPLVFGEIDGRLGALGGGAIVPMLTRFQSDWFAESQKWVNATVKTAAGESPGNAQLVTDWTRDYLALAHAAVLPLAALAFGDEAGRVCEDVVAQFKARVAKLGVTL